MESVAKNVRDNIFSIVSVNKDTRRTFEDEGLPSEGLKDLLSLVIQRVKKPTKEDIKVSESVGESDSAFALSKCKSVYFIEASKLVLDDDNLDLSSITDGLDKRLGKVVRLAENKVFVKLQQKLYEFKQKCSKGDTTDLEKHNAVNPYFSMVKEVKKALKESKGFSSLKPKVQEEALKDYPYLISSAVISRLIHLYCKDDVQHIINGYRGKGGVQECNGDKENCNGNCGCKEKSEVSTETKKSCSGKDKEDCACIERVIWFALGLIAGMVLYHFIEYIY